MGLLFAVGRMGCCPWWMANDFEKEGAAVFVQVEGFFPTLGAQLYRVASDLEPLLERWLGYLSYDEAKRIMDRVVIAQVLVMPVVIAFILVCVTAMVMRRYKGIR